MNVLLTSGSKKSSMYFNIKGALNRFDPKGVVYVGDTNPKALLSYMTEYFWLMPELKDLSFDIVMDFCKKNNIQFIIPSRDGELLFWSKIKLDLFKNGINVMVSDEESISLCLDKLEFYNFLNSLNINVIPTYENLDICQSDRIVLKERFGAGSENILVGISKLETKNKISKFVAPIIQPFIEGEEYSIDLYIDNSYNNIGSVVRKRALVVDGESKVTYTENNSELKSLCENAAKKLKINGHCVFQAIVDKNNEYHLIECNCRFGGASTISIRYGLDSFYWFLQEANGFILNKTNFINKKNIMQVRVPNDYYYDL